MEHLRTLSLILLSLVLGGCASMPTANELASADYGRYMSQSECENDVKQVLASYLKDPYSAQYRFGQCQKMGMGSAPVLGVPKQYGYSITTFVNAKNSFGGYTGEVTYIMLFKNGQVIRKGRQNNDLGVILPF